MEHISTAIHNATGYLHQGCPWRLFQRPLIADVMDAHPYLKEGNLGAYLGHDAPVRLVEAVGLYEQQLQSLLNDERRKSMDRAKADRSNVSAVQSVIGKRRG